MLWKIATLILFIVAFLLYRENIQMTKNLAETRQELYNSQNTNTELTGIKSTAESLQDQLKLSEEKAKQLKVKVTSLGRKYPITIKTITFLNVNQEGNSSSPEAPSTVILKSDLQYLVPVVTFDNNLEQDTSIIVYYQLTGPGQVELKSGEDARIKYQVNLGTSGKKENEVRLPAYYIDTGEGEREIPTGEYKIDILLNDHIIFQETFQII